MRDTAAAEPKCPQRLRARDVIDLLLTDRRPSGPPSVPKHYFSIAFLIARETALPPARGFTCKRRGQTAVPSGVENSGTSYLSGKNLGMKVDENEKKKERKEKKRV